MPLSGSDWFRGNVLADKSMNYAKLPYLSPHSAPIVHKSSFTKMDKSAEVHIVLLEVDHRNDVLVLLLSFQ